MLIVIVKDYNEVSTQAARIVANAIRAKPDLRLGLATGHTPLGLYKELVQLFQSRQLDFSRLVTFNLDEYLGLSPDHPQSYHHYMRTALFDHVNVQQENIHIPDGTVQNDFALYCARYEEDIRDSGGIDLQILGIGKTGHIGFNEPTSSFRSRTRLKTLTAQTIQDNQKYFEPNSRTPECAITMGIGTILESKRILLLASGKNKATPIARAVEGPLTASVSASALQLHKNVTIILDEDAASQLAHKDYYARVLEMTLRLTPERLY